MNNNMPNAYEGDMFIDPCSEKTFYFTGDRWLDITAQSKTQKNLWNLSSIELQSDKPSEMD
jgi:hypothetical protein